MTIEQIWSQYRLNIKNFLHSKVSNYADVDDLLQEIMLKSYQQIGSLSSEQSLKSWLYQIANRTVIDFYRKQASDNRLKNIEILTAEADLDVYSELSACLVPFIQALPVNDERLLNAIVIQGQSQKAYAEENSISYSTLKSQVQKARGNLKLIFEQCCTFDLNQKGELIEANSNGKQCNNC